MPVARGALKLVASGADVVRRPPTGVVILIYHRVGARTASSIDLPVALFAEQMAALAASGTVISLDEAVALLESDETTPAGGRVVITFDDGTADFVDDALPVLVQNRLPATLYVATDFVEHGLDFPGDGHPATWSGLAEAVSTGIVTIGSHTDTHALLDRLPADQVPGELDRSIELIGERLGVTAGHFAYPKALPGNPAADRAVRQRFTSAAIAGTRPNPYGHSDLHALRRSPIQVADGMRWFSHKVRGGMWAEDALRRMVNRRRYAGSTT